MLPHKNQSEAYFRSEPVSRTGSSQRLSHLGQPNLPSRAATPQPYVTSSLNPVRNAPVNTRSSSTEEKNDSMNFDSLPIVEQITEFEQNLQELSTKITSFKEDGLDTLVKNLIKINDELRAKTSELDTHQQLGKEIKQLQSTGASFDNKFRSILKELISCRNELKKLPKKPSETKDPIKPNDFSTEDALKYAMKLAKFTKAPPTITQPYQIHPNNYVWPAEDALRRGMLAQCSLQPDEIINSELGTSPVELVQHSASPQEQEKTVEKERKGSFGDYGSFNAKEKKEDDQPLDLDLFDPDDEFSD